MKIESHPEFGILYIPDGVDETEAFARTTRLAYVHHSGRGPLGVVRPRLEELMREHGFKLLREQGFLEASDRFLRHHPSFRNPPSTPLEKCRIVLLVYGK